MNTSGQPETTCFQELDEDKFRMEAFYKTRRPILRVIALCHGKIFQVAGPNPTEINSEAVSQALEEAHAECERILGKEELDEFWNNTAILDILDYVNMCTQGTSTEAWINTPKKPVRSSKEIKAFRAKLSKLLKAMMENFYTKISAVIDDEDQEDLITKRRKYGKNIDRRRRTKNGLTFSEGVKAYVPQTGEFEIPIWNMEIATDIPRHLPDDNDNIIAI
jgi:hypothetical protein